MISLPDTVKRGARTAAHKTPTLLSWDQLLSVPHSEIPAIVGELEQAKTTLLARLLEPENCEPEEDLLLTADQVAEKLQVDRKWVYRHKARLGAIPLSKKHLRFPSSALDAYIRRRGKALRGRR